MSQLRKTRYLIWDFNKTEPYSNELYDTLKGCKGAVSYILKFHPSYHVGIMEFDLVSTGKALKKVEKDWIEVKGVAKLLYV